KPNRKGAPLFRSAPLLVMRRRCSVRLSVVDDDADASKCRIWGCESVAVECSELVVVNDDVVVTVYQILIRNPVDCAAAADLAINGRQQEAVARHAIDRAGTFVRKSKFIGQCSSRAITSPLRGHLVSQA